MEDVFMKNILKEGTDFTWGIFNNGLNMQIPCPWLNDNVKLIPVSNPSKKKIMYIFDKDTKELIPVLILDGEWLSNGRISNWWKWQELNDNLDLGKIKSGYGKFYEPNKEFKVEVSYKITNI